METSVPPPKGPQQATAASLRTPCGIGDLPPEVLLNIFQFFNVQQLDGTISPVCRLWRDLSQRPCVRLELAVEFGGQNTAVACDLLRSCPNLKDLSISDRDDVNHLLHHVALYNHDLRRLAVKRCNDWSYSPSLSEKVLDEILICCPKIVDLTVINSALQSNKFFRDLGVRLPELRRINFNHNSLFGPEELRMIVTRCPKLEEIRALWLCSCSPPLCDKDILLVAESLCRTLKVLLIYGEQLSDKAIAALGQCCQLRKLHIQNALKVTYNGVSHLSCLHNLDDLQLSGADMVSSSGWVQLFSRSNWIQMKNLSLAGCDNVDDDTLQQIATACPNLMKLDLAWTNHFTDGGLRSVLQMCTNLEHLRICTKQKYVFRSFSHIPLHTPRLKRLVYNAQGLEEEKRVFMYLKETMPECYIIRE